MSALAAPLGEGLATLQIALTLAQQEKLLDYIALLEKWNRTYNLTAVREPARMLGLHVLDSLALLPHLGAATRVLDVGTGAGLPGIVLGIAAPELKITMLDSLQKKTTFVQQAINELGLKNASVICERVENFRPTESFDVVTSRAFAELGDFVNGAGHLVAPEGRLIAMKGVHPHDEIARLPAGFQVARVIPLQVPQVEGQRHLVVVKKG